MPLTLEGKQALTEAIIFARDYWADTLHKHDFYTEEQQNEFSIGMVIGRLRDQGHMPVVFGSEFQYYTSLHIPDRYYDLLIDILSEWEGMAPNGKRKVFWRYCGCLS